MHIMLIRENGELAIDVESDCVLLAYFDRDECSVKGYSYANVPPSLAEDVIKVTVQIAEESAKKLYTGGYNNDK